MAAKQVIVTKYIEDEGPKMTRTDMSEKLKIPLNFLSLGIKKNLTNIHLRHLTLASSTAFATDPPGTVVGEIENDVVGSSLVVSPDDGRFSVQSSELILGNNHTEPGTYTFNLIESISGSSNSPRTSQITVTILPTPQIILSGTLSIPEDASVGTTIGALTVVNGLGTYEFTKITDADGKFSLTGSIIELAAPIDYETKTFHDVTFHADSGEGPTVDRTFRIAVTNVIEGILGPTTAMYNNSDIPGTPIAAVTGLDAGANETIVTIAPNDGRLSIVAGNQIIKGISPSFAGTINYSLTTSEGRVLNIAITVNQSEDPDGSVLLLSDGSVYGLAGDQAGFDLGIHYSENLAFHNLSVLTELSPNDLIVIRTTDGSRKMTFGDLLDSLENF
jgi:hypothetical protein